MQRKALDCKGLEALTFIYPGLPGAARSGTLKLRVYLTILEWRFIMGDRYRWLLEEKFLWRN
jgi:hypothetical protein